MKNELNNGCCPSCGSILVCACEGFWKCTDCGVTSTGIKLSDPLNSLSVILNPKPTDTTKKQPK